jgi:hypothetical protein
MTVASAQNRAGPFNGDGVTAQFDFNIPYQKNADIRVLRRVLATGVETTLAHLSDYSLANAGTGGRLTLASPLTVGHRIVVVRAPEVLQETDLIENDTYSAETIEKALDYGIMVSARLADQLTRALLLADSDIYGAGAFNAGGNRITGAANAVSATDLTTLAQVQALVAAGGGGGGGGGGGPVIIDPTWPTIPIPESVLDTILAGILTQAEFNAVFAPINSQIGNLANQIIGQNSTISSISTSIGTLNTTINGMQAAIDLLEQLQGDGTEIITLISTETTQRIDGDSAIAVLISKIGAADGDAFSFLINTSTAKIGPSETLAQRFGSIQAGLSTNTAAISTESTTRATADSAMAQTISKIGALANAGAAFLLDVNSVLVTPTESLAQRLVAIGTSVGTATAAVQTETNARVSADASLASQISTIQSTVGGFSSAISTNATAINGVYAQYSVKVDNNGRVAGFGLISQPINGSIVSSFIFNADAFSIFNGASAVAPFTVVGGVVRMQNVEILNANIANLSIGKLLAGTLNADMTMGTGRIIYDNGVVMKVDGIGFGTSNQFVEWFGLRPAGGNVSLCSESNARSYRKINGDEYMGGTLIVGVRRNAAQTGNTAATALVEVLNFTTLGGNKNVSVSYDLSYIAQTASSANPGNPTATVRLYRKLGAGSYVEINSVAVTGSRDGVDNVDVGVWEHDMRAIGSITMTDTEASVSNFSYKAEITARSTPGTVISITQTMSVLSVEG